MKKQRIVFATSNAGKMNEIRQILGDLDCEILSMKEAGLDLDIVENGSTYAENAAIKARAVWLRTGGIVLADDSGMEVNYLNDEPGVLSARYLGEDVPYSVKCQSIIDRLAGVTEAEERRARYVCNIAAMLPAGNIIHTQATMEGYIANKPSGDNGFAYDPILYIGMYAKTVAELTTAEKNRISHRGLALENMKQTLLQYALVTLK